MPQCISYRVLTLFSMRISGKLPQVLLSLSDERILEVLQLVMSITLPDAALPLDTDSDSDYEVSLLYHCMRLIVRYTVLSVFQIFSHYYSIVVTGMSQTITRGYGPRKYVQL